MDELSTPDLVHKPRDGSGEYRRTIDTVHRDAEAARLHARGHTYDQIATELGYVDRGHVWKAVRRVLVDTARTEGADILRQQMTAELQEIRREAWDDVTHPQCLVDRMGRQVLGPDGEPMPDRMQKATSLQVVLKALGQLATLRGVNAPKTSVHMGHADIDALMKMANEQIAQMDRERNTDRRRANAIAVTAEPPDE